MTTTILYSPPQRLENRLINGEFGIWQRGTSVSAQADDTYGGMGDRWYILTQTGTIAGARQDNPFDGARYSGQLTQSQAVAQRIGAAQIIEGKNCIDLRGQAVIFYGRFKISNNQDVRVALLEWTGTEDTVTSDIVNDWTSADYTDGAAKFFVDANFTPSVVKEYALPGTGWVDFFTTVTLGSTFTNLVVFVWTEGTAAQNVTLSMANCGLIRGSAVPVKHTPRPQSVEEYLCYRYYEKTFAPATAPAQGTGLFVNDLFHRVSVLGASVAAGALWRFKATKRASPTITTYNGANANAKWYNGDDAGDSGTPTVQATGPDGCFITNPGVATDAVGEGCYIHATAVAEL